jgi:hypothetical protein
VLFVGEIRRFQQGDGGDLQHPEALLHPRRGVAGVLEAGQQGVHPAQVQQLLRQVLQCRLHQEHGQIYQVQPGSGVRADRQFLRCCGIVALFHCQLHFLRHCTTNCDKQNNDIYFLLLFINKLKLWLVIKHCKKFQRVVY